MPVWKKTAVTDDKTKTNNELNLLTYSMFPVAKDWYNYSSVTQFRMIQNY